MAAMAAPSSAVPRGAGAGAIPAAGGDNATEAAFASFRRLAIPGGIDVVDGATLRIVARLRHDPVQPSTIGSKHLRGERVSLSW
jgi:hypothetical protein